MGVFYREYAKMADFPGVTRLSFLHVHNLALGLFFFLFMAALEKLFSFSAQRGVRLTVILYDRGLNITGLGLLLRGLADVAGEGVPRGLDGTRGQIPRRSADIQGDRSAGFRGFL